MKTMPHILAVPLIVALASCATTGSAVSVQFNGCVSAGVEPNCLMLVSGGVTYDVSLASPRPAINMGMVGDGTILNGPTTCQQGVALTNIHWRPSRQRCPRAAFLRRNGQAA